MLPTTQKILSIYFTAGYPTLNSTVFILEQLQANGVNLVEIGMPYSDPLADGPVIQESSAAALANGMSIKVLLAQLKNIRHTVHIPLVLMGYFNPILQYGVEAFLQQIKAIGINMVILPDMPLHVYTKTYKALFNKYQVENIFLITPNTSPERILEIDNLTNAFIYAVSSSSTTGNFEQSENHKTNYFLRLKNMQLKNPVVVGFGINNNKTYVQACQHLQGGIIGTAFIKHLTLNINKPNFGIENFISTIKNN